MSSERGDRTLDLRVMNPTLLPSELPRQTFLFSAKKFAKVMINLSTPLDLFGYFIAFLFMFDNKPMIISMK